MGIETNRRVNPDIAQCRDGKRFRALLASEQDSAALYRGLAASANGERRQVFLELAAVEDRHAHWVGKLTAIGEPVPPRTRVGLRSRALTWLAQRSSVDAVLPYVERAHAQVYLDSTTSHKKPTDRSISGD